MEPTRYSEARNLYHQNFRPFCDEQVLAHQQDAIGARVASRDVRNKPGANGIMKEIIGRRMGLRQNNKSTRRQSDVRNTFR